MSNNCKKCGEPRQQQKSGRWRCRPCDNEYQKQNYATRADAMRKRKRDHMARARNNPETRQKYLGYQRKAWKNGGSEKKRAWLKSIRTTDPWRWKAHIVHVGHSGKALKAIFDLQSGKCGLTGRQLDFQSMQLDHITPKSRGGGNQIDNLRWVCKEANMAKRDLLDAEFVALCINVAEWLARRILAFTANTEEK